MLAQPERAVVADDRLGEVAGLVLEDGEDADAVGERRVVGQPLGHPAPDPIADLAPPRREDLLDEVVAADGLDRLDEARREPAVVGREEALRVGGDVVDVARPADAVLLGGVADEARLLERVELLEDAGPARARAPPRGRRASSGPPGAGGSRIARRSADGEAPASADLGAASLARRRRAAAGVEAGQCPLARPWPRG